MTRNRIRWIVAAVAAMAWGGVSHAAEASQPSPGTFAPLRPGAVAYGKDPGLACPTRGLLAILPGQVGALAQEAKRPVPQAEGALCAMADTFLEWTEPSGPPDRVVAFASRHFGLPTPVRQVTVTKFPTDDREAISERLAETILAFGKNAAQPRYGAAMVILPRSDKFAKPESLVVLVLADETVQLDLLPRRLALGQQAMLSGQVTGGAENPKVFVSQPDGHLSRPEQVPGKAFRAELRCGDRPGEIRVEVNAEVAGERRPVANFPVACGKELATSLPLGATVWPSDRAAQEKKVLEIINAERAGAGLQALVWDDAVAGVARSLSEGLSDETRRGAAAVSVVEQLQKAGVPSPLLLVNPVQARTVDDAQERLLTSPGHRANLMNPEINHAGVGITTVTEKSGATTTFLAEVFVKVLPPVDLVQVRKDLQAAIAERRVEGKVPEIPVDTALHEVAQKYAQEMAAAKGKLPEERDTQMLDTLKKTYKGVNMLAGAAAAPLEFAKEKKVLASGKALGVGLAQGDHPKLGRNAFYVVILLGEPREAAKLAKPPAKPPAKTPPGK